MLVISGLGSLCILAMLIFLILPGTAGPNRFGPDPLSGTAMPSSGADASYGAPSVNPEVPPETAVSATAPQCLRERCGTDRKR